MLEIGAASLRIFQMNNTQLRKDLEKLSSGRRINRAGDGAAELCISEKMKMVISGTAQAQQNVKDAISLVQTGEAALDEVHQMLNRMLTLAEQSANGTYDDGTDRVSLQKEVRQLKSEIDRIAESTNFNGIFLFDEGGQNEGNTGNTDAVSGSTGGTGSGSSSPNTPSVTPTPPPTPTPDPEPPVQESVWTDETSTAGQEGVATPATWTGTIDLNNVSPGSLLIINDGKKEVKFLCTTDANAPVEEGYVRLLLNNDVKSNLEVALKNSVLSHDDSKCKVTAEGNNVFKVELTGLPPTKAEENGQTFEVKTGDTVDTSEEIKCSIDNWGETAFIDTPPIVDGEPVGKAIPLSVIQDGAKLSLFGQEFYIYLDGSSGVQQNASTTLDLSSAKDETAYRLLYALEDALIEKGVCGDNGDLSLSVNLEDESSFDMSIMIDTTEVSLSGFNEYNIIKFEIARNEAKVDDVSMTESKYVEAKKATQSGTLDTSALQDGDTVSITVGSEKFSLTFGQDVPVEDKTPDDIIALLIEKIKQSALKDLIEVSYTLNDEKAQLEFKALAAVEGQTISVDYQSAAEQTPATQSSDSVNTPVTYAALPVANTPVAYAALPVANTPTTYAAASSAAKVNTGNSAVRSRALPAQPTQNEFIFQVGLDKDETLKLVVDYVSCESIGIQDVDISTAAQALDSIQTIRGAINTVSDNRGTLGAVQNRLEHTHQTLAITEENMTDSESTIADTDTAQEVMRFTRHQILLQSSQSMIAQSMGLAQERVKGLLFF